MAKPTPSDFLASLEQEFPHLTFKSGPRFSYRPPRTISYDLSDPHFHLLILHELGHATIAEQDYKTDVARLKIERAAWDQAASYCQKFSIPFDEDFVEEELDTYRTWLHNKSKCPLCGLTRYQDQKGVYHCPHCD